MTNFSSDLRGFCDDPIWDGALTWDGDWPRFTNCFLDTLLIWIPCGFLWLAAPFYVLYLASLPVTGQGFARTCLYQWKMTLLVAATVLTSVDVVNVSDDRLDSKVFKADVFAPIVLTVSLVLVIIFTYVERRKKLVTSGVQFTFWLLLCVARIIPFYTAIELKEYSTSETSFYLSCFETMLYYLIFLLHFFPEKTLQTFHLSKPPCKELQASFPSRLAFWWTNSLLRHGYASVLTENCMTDLRPWDKCQAVIARFLPSWTAAVQKAQADQAMQEQKGLIHAVHHSNTNNANETTPLLIAASSVKSSYQQDGSSSSSSSGGSRAKHSNRLTKPSLVWALIRTFWIDILLSNIWKLFYDVLLLCNPLLLGALVEYVEQQSPAVWRGYVLAIGLFVSMMLQTLLFHRTFHFATSLGLRLRASLISSVFRKALTMDNVARRESTVGEVENLMSVDAEHVEGLMSYAWAMWSSPLQIGLSLYLLYLYVGVSMFAGAAFLLLLIPANGVVTSLLGRYETEIMQFKDERMKVMNEMLAGIKIVKFFAWEKSFEQKILEVRELELKRLLYTGLLESIVTFSWTAAPFLTSWLTYLCYVMVSKDHYLDPKTAFVAISLFDILRFAMNFLPSVITDLIKARVSLKRIGNFLRHKDLDDQYIDRDPAAEKAISIHNGTFSWQAGLEATLTRINVQVRDKSLVAVVGPVGCGKSSLLSALLGEMEKLEGRVNIRGKIAYVPQQAWIQNDTLRNNILFGKPMNERLYVKCIEGCALQPDLDILPCGDQTEIGEKGINLSGGQKQRVSLARALYAQAEIYLMDDPLSAVDSHVGRHIFDKVVGRDGLLSGRVRVLVTHGVQYLPDTDHVIVMDDGRVTESGHYETLLKHNGPFSRLITAFLKQEDPDVDGEDEAFTSLKQEMLQRLSETEGEDDTGHISDRPPSEIFRKLSRSASRISESGMDTKKEEKLIKRQASQVGNIIEEEKVEVGRVNMKVFGRYLRAVGFVYCALMVGCYFLYVSFEVAGTIFLSSWTDDTDLANFTKWPADSSERRDTNNYYIGIYGMFGALQTIFIMVFSIIESYRLVAASRQLHADMLTSILHAPMAFFDTTPAGRIINRFSTDLDEVDEELPITYVMWIDCVMQMVAIFVVISYSTPIFLAFILPIGLVYFFVQRYFITTSRQLKRLGSKTLSPIFNHFGESLTGASVIRAFGAQKRFVLESEAKVDLNQGFMFYNYCANRWLGVRLETLGNFIVLLAAGIAVATSDSISAGLMGLSISYALSITEDLNWLVRMTSDLETQIVAVERIMEYTDIDCEAEWENELYKSPPGWPSKGAIKIENLSLRYRPGLDLVLKDINLEVKPGEKVGIVGRTGAGKSSLTLALFRLVEAANGHILIDNVDISNLGLHDLRSKVTILPQDPVMFAGTLRDNLDPFSQFTDAAVWEALEHAHLKKFVDSLGEGIGHPCAEGGENLSVGQRQLVCLARALLHKTKILILDEATAAVDVETDELIQTTIRTEFRDCTVLTIAHRLNTVLDYDRILVLDKGEVKEYGTPDALLDDVDSIFYSMAKSSGLTLS